MKLIATIVATRILNVGEPEKGQSKDEFLQNQRESLLDDPFSFIDSADTQCLAVVAEVPAT